MWLNRYHYITGARWLYIRQSDTILRLGEKNESVFRLQRRAGFGRSFKGDMDRQNERPRSRREYENENARRRRLRKARRARRERELRRKKRILAAVILLGIVLAAGLGIVAARSILSNRDETTDASEQDAAAAETVSAAGTTEENAENTAENDAAEDAGGHTAAAGAPYVFTETDSTVRLGESLTDISIYDAQRHITSENAQTETSESALSDAEKEEAAKASDYVDSQYAIVVNTATGEILAERRAFERMVPASMTKVMTLLVAVEAMEDQESQLQDLVTITQEICDESYSSGSSFVGYGVGDTATVEDLLYGAILPSGADAAMALAEYTSGTQEAFAELMNQKAQELGISETTHFTNCVGLYDENHYSTAYDMCVIMRAAIDNELCRKVLSAHTWKTAALKDNPDGVELSNWFLRRIEDHDSGGTVVCGKTGFVNESGNCAVSYQESEDGTGYIACTGLTYNLWRCIYDHVALYKTYAK